MLKLAFINVDTTNSKLPVLKQEVRRLQSAGYQVFGFNDVTDFFSPDVLVPVELNNLEKNDLEAGFLPLVIETPETPRQLVMKKNSIQQRINDLDEQNQQLAKDLDIELFPVTNSQPHLNTIARARLQEIMAAIARSCATREWHESAGLIIDKNKNEKWHIINFDIVSRNGMVNGYDTTTPDEIKNGGNGSIKKFKSSMAIYANKLKLSVKLNYGGNTYNSLSDSLRNVDHSFNQKHPILVKLASVAFFCLLAISLAAPVAYVTLPLLIAMATTGAAAFMGLVIGSFAGYLFTRTTSSVALPNKVPRAIALSKEMSPIISSFNQADVHRHFLLAQAVNHPSAWEAVDELEDAESDNTPTPVGSTSRYLSELYESETPTSVDSTSKYLPELYESETPTSTPTSTSRRLNSR